MTQAEQIALVAECERLTSDARRVLAKVHESLTTEQHACERRLSYAHDCLSDAMGYLADAKTFVTGAG